MSVTVELEPITYAQSESGESTDSFVPQRKENLKKKIKDKPLPPLVVTIPSAHTAHSSAESSQTSSPTGILSPKHSQSQLHAHLSVTFAPLPQKDKRKRRSTVPLGIAARGQLVSRRRGGGHHHSPMWTEEEVEEHMKRYGNGNGYEEEGVEDVEDPFLVLGRMVKGASKSIWRRVSGGHQGKKGVKQQGVLEDEQQQQQAAGPGVEQNLEQRREVDGSGTDRVGEDSENESVSLTVDQTETIVEGTVQLSWIQPEELGLSISSSPTSSASASS
jgi:hypothetical protein